MRFCNCNDRSEKSNLNSFLQLVNYNCFNKTTFCRRIPFKGNSSGYKKSTNLIMFSGLLSFIFGKEEDKESELITSIKRGVLSIQVRFFKLISCC